MIKFELPYIEDLFTILIYNSNDVLNNNAAIGLEDILVF